MSCAFPFPRVACLLLCATLCAGAEEPVRFDAPGLENAFRVTDRILSGSQPAGDAAFAGLARLGVKTIVSVDGARPDVEAARKHGLRTIHLPFGYDGIPAARIPQLIGAASVAEGRVYVHCHHGKHRGPAAVGVMCEGTAGWTPERAEAWLRQAGTGEEYAGLFRNVREFKPVPPSTDELPEVAETPALVDAMVAMDERFDLLKAIQEAGWKTPPGHADLSPAHEATLLWEQLRELARTGDTARRSEDYRARLTASEKAAEALRATLRSAAPDRPALDAAFKKAGQSCAACHKEYRNTR